MLGFVVLSSALALVLGLLDSSLLVALLQVVDDVLVQLLNALLQRRGVLDPNNKIQN